MILCIFECPCGVKATGMYEVGTFIECRQCGRIFYDKLNPDTLEVTLKELKDEEMDT